MSAVETPAVPGAARDHAPGLERAFAEPPRERGVVACRVEGRLPEFVRGRYYLNGPARFERGGLRYRHWLDGDGMLVALDFGDAGVHATARFVQSAKWRAEEQAGRALYRTFGTAFPGDRLLHGLALESPANVSVHAFDGCLLACGEQGLPYAVDPLTLETLGPYTFGGALNPISPFSAHLRLDPVSGELWNFGVSFAAAQPALHVYAFDRRGRQRLRRRWALPWPCSLHDFALSPRYAVFHLTPYLLDMQLLTRPGATLMDALRFEPGLEARLWVVERASGARVADLAYRPGYSLHCVHLAEHPQGPGPARQLTLDLLELERPVYDQYQVLPELFGDVGRGQPVRLTIDLETPALVARAEIAYDLAPDFAAVDTRLFGRATDELWMLGVSATGRPGRKFFDELVHARWSEPQDSRVWRAPRGVYLGGEPVFVGGPRAHDGAVLVPLFDAAREASRVAVFDAARIELGPQAEVLLDTPLHLGFHAAFVPAAGRGPA